MQRRLFFSVRNLAIFSLTLLGMTSRSQADWEQTGSIAAPEARQAAAADEKSVYAIDNKVVVRYDRETGEKLATSTGPAWHLNSGFILDVKMYCAHSNYPMKPEQSEIKVLDLQSMELSEFKSFPDPPGSITVVLKKDGHWWCVFAHYKEDNAKTLLVKYDDKWNELARWTFPESVISGLGNYSISGAIWSGEELLATGHDEKLIYRLQVPEGSSVVRHLGTVKAPFTGQGIAVDPNTGGLIGINRKNKEVLFAMPKQMMKAN